MAIHIEPEKGVKMRPPPKIKDLAVKASAAAETAKLLHEKGLEIKPNAEDKDIAATLAVSYAEDPEKTSKAATPNRVANLTPATLLMTDRILKDFGHSVVKSATQVRYLVTNKLIEETENPDPRIRIRALELLGKVSDVGLFAEKSEVTITHQTTDDLKEKLREKLTRLVNPEPEIEDAIVVEGKVIDVDKELGLDDE
tara:strand:- start:246 stop:839 length:594 start_codon:yes stop_codon:yes gene_type:complete